MWPGRVPVHAVVIVEFFDPETDSIELGQIVDDGLRTWSALGMVTMTQAHLSHAMVVDFGDDDDTDV